MSKPVVGVQLYTVRESIKTISGITETLKRVAKIGYRAVQIASPGPVDIGEVSAVIRDVGLTVASTHTKWNRFLEELDVVIEEHKLWGSKHAAIGGLPVEYYTADGVRRFVDELTPVAERLAGEGMDFSYHNHSRELARCNGQTWLDKLYSESESHVLKAEIDTYWIQAGGGDPAAWVRKCAGREPLLHLKDMSVTDRREQRFAEIGEGNLNWAAILDEADKGGVECLLVEQDQCYGRSPFDALVVSYRNLRDMGYT